MLSIEKCSAPENTILEKYLIDGNYVDCYTTTIDQQVSFSEFVFAFYTTWLFKVEQFILTYTVRKPSSDVEARKLANAEIDKFAAWTIESRRDNELLLCDFVGRTRSWLMIENDEAKTKLYFGSAVVPQAGSESLDFGFRALLGFHQIYSVLLLYFAKRKLVSSLRGG